MIKPNYWHFKVSKSTWILFFALALSSFTKANPYTDTSKKQLLAAAKKDNAGFVTHEANVVFPDILTGNEEEALLYIEKFAVNRRAYLIRTYNRSKKYFPKVTAILKKYIVVGLTLRNSLPACIASPQPLSLRRGAQTLHHK